MTPSPQSVLVKVRLAPMSALLGHVQVRALWAEPRPVALNWKLGAPPRQPRTGWTPMAAPPAGKA